MTSSDRHISEPVSEAWSALQPGAPLTVVKLAPDGAEAARYAGDVIGGLDQDGWIVVHAKWTHRSIELDGLAFCPGDGLLEWFSPRHPFNAFAVLSPEGLLKGWYANVTYPARVDLAVNPPVLIWHDLYVDLVGLPDKSFTIRDDDELLASGLRTLDPALHGEILRARSEMIRRFAEALPPFSTDSEVAQMQAAHKQRATVR